MTLSPSADSASSVTPATIVPGTRPPTDHPTWRSKAASSLARMMNRFNTVVTTVIGPGTKRVSINASKGAATSAEPKPTPPCTHAPRAIAAVAASA